MDRYAYAPITNREFYDFNSGGDGNPAYYQAPQGGIIHDEVFYPQQHGYDQGVDYSR